MLFYFEIEDRLGTKQAIEDPIGWDATSLILERDPGGKHGVFFMYQAQPYVYEREAGRILTKEYQQYGEAGKMWLNISIDCQDGSTVFVDRLKFVFSSFQQVTGGVCSVSIPVESNDDGMTLRHRLDQKVNLDSLVAFDGTTALSAYTAAPFTKTIPAKGILLSDAARNTPDQLVAFPGVWVDSGAGATQGWPQLAFFALPFSEKSSAEFGGFSFPGATESCHDETMPNSWTKPADWVELPFFNATNQPFDRYFPLSSVPAIVNYDVEFGPIYGAQAVTIEGKYDRTVGMVLDPTLTTTGINIWGIYLGILKAGTTGANAADWTWLSTGDATKWNVWSNNTSPLTATTRRTFTFSFSVTLNPGDRVYYFDKLMYSKVDTLNQKNAFLITNHDGSYFKLYGTTHTPASTAKLYMINEALSRIAEAVTNNRLRLYSEWLGRKDSQPYALASSDGCGSHKAITTGLLIRQAEATRPAKIPKFTLSMNDAWAGLNPLDNLGLGIEPDPNRAGFQRLRIEPWDYFYEPNNIVLQCRDVRELKREVQTGLHYSTFKFGYTKWEADEWKSVDEFMSTREYRVNLESVSNTFQQLSTFVGSSFAIEAARRIGNFTTDNYDYDDDTFVIAMRRQGGNVNNPLEVQAGDITGAQNINEPATVLNFALRPSIIALRWLPQVLAGYKQSGFSSRLIFTSGEGNIYAAGMRSGGTCIPEAHVLTEQQDYTPNDLAAPNKGVPIYELERVTYTYPLSVPDFNALRADPLGLIYWNNETEFGYGWLDRLDYKIAEGLATFTLIPQKGTGT